MVRFLFSINDLCVRTAGRGNVPVGSGAAKYGFFIHIDRPGAEIISSINEMDAKGGEWLSCTGDDARPTWRRDTSNRLYRTLRKRHRPRGICRGR
jgi:hypothetical protein